MLTLAKRPQPQLGNIPSRGIDLSENDYAYQMRERAIREGHLRATVTVNPDAAFTDAIGIGSKTTVEIAARVDCSREHARKRLLRLEACGMVSVDRTGSALWSLKCKT